MGLSTSSQRALGVPSKTLVIHFDTLFTSHTLQIFTPTFTFHFHFSKSLHIPRVTSFVHAEPRTTSSHNHHHHDVRLATITIIVINFQRNTPLPLRSHILKLKQITVNSPRSTSRHTATSPSKSTPRIPKKSTSKE